MREIKFRAWIKNRKEMRQVDEIYEGYFIKEDNDTYSGVHIKEEGRKKQRTENQSNVILMQYTGLKDKNGKEIYEFDYVEYKGSKYKVFFNKYKVSLENISKKDIIDLTDEIISDLSINGNYYEN